MQAYKGCHYAEFFTQSVVMMGSAMLSVIILNVEVLCEVKLSVI
jgi:hypothetical protein